MARKFRQNVRRVYSRARSRASKATLPLIAIPVGIAAVAPFVAGKNGALSTSDTVASHLSVGNWNSALVCAGREATNLKNYIPVIVAVLGWGIARKLVGKGRITKKISVL